MSAEKCQAVEMSEVEYVHLPNILTAALPERDSLEFAFSLALATFPPSDYHIEKIIAEGDKVIVQWQPNYPAKQPRPARPLIGRQEIPIGITVLRHANGKIIEAWESWDRQRNQAQL
jgi:hypothetical protein